MLFTIPPSTVLGIKPEIPRPVKTFPVVVFVVYETKLKSVTFLALIAKKVKRFYRYSFNCNSTATVEIGLIDDDSAPCSIVTVMLLLNDVNLCAIVSYL